MKEDYLSMGKKALAIGAWEDAQNLLVQAVSKQPSPEAFEELAWAYWWLNDIESVFELRTRAHNTYLILNDKRGASRTASWLGLDYLEYNGEFAIANGWFQRAENLLESEEECGELCLIKTLKANLAFRVDRDTPKALALLDETIALSKRLHDVERLMMAEGLKGFMLVTEGRVSEGMQLLDEATVIALGQESGNIHSIATTCCFLIDACQRVRDYERAGQWCNKVKEICRRWRHKAVFATCRTQYASVLVWRGEWEQAEVELSKAIEELAKFKPASLNTGFVRLADLRRRQGRWTESTELLEKIKTDWTKALVCSALYYDQENFQMAYDLADKFLRQIPINQKTERIAGLELFIRSAIKLERIEEADKHLQELETIANTITTPPIKATWLVSKGIVHHAVGKNDSARKSLEDALDLYEQLECPFEAARTRVQLSFSLDALNQVDAAKEMLYEAIRIFKELGAKRDLEKSRSRLKTLGSAGDGNLGLTKREIDILKQISVGKNNEQISDTLSLSVRTVEKHLSNIYQKLGISGKSARAYAASFTSKNLH